MEHAFGRAAPFALGVEEELLLVDPATLALAGVSSRIVPEVRSDAGAVMHDVYEALVETASPICAGTVDAVAALAELRRALRKAGATLIGAGIHPGGAFGDAPHVPRERYRVIAESMRGLLRRTPTCALHIHVGMPDPESAIAACNGMRPWLPVLQGLTANSPFWHGRDSGFQTARAQLFRAYPRAVIPRPFSGWQDYLEMVDAWVEAADVPDYTYLWWDMRPHPRLGTLEVRAMDAQSRLSSVAGLAALVHGLVVAAAHGRGAPGPPMPPEVLIESSFRAGRDGLAATVWWDGALRPLPEIAREALAVARPHAREAGAEGALEEVERILREGGGADRARAAHAAGGMRAVLENLRDEALEPYG